MSNLLLDKHKNNAVLFIPLLFFFLILTQTSYAFKKENVMVYASLEEQKIITEYYLKNSEENEIWEIIPETITPVYCFNPIGYKEGDEIEVEQGYLYVAKFINHDPSSSEEYPYGSLEFNVSKNGKIISCHQVFSNKVISYADYAEALRVLLGREKIINESYIRLVRIERYGLAFFVNDEIDTCFILVDGGGLFDMIPYTGLIHEGVELENLGSKLSYFVDHYNDGDKSGNGGAIIPREEICGVFLDYNLKNDIIDVSEYLGIDYSKYDNHFLRCNNWKKINWVSVFTAGFVVTGVLVVVIIAIKRKNSQKLHG